MTETTNHEPLDRRDIPTLRMLAESLETIADRCNYNISNEFHNLFHSAIKTAEKINDIIEVIADTEHACRYCGQSLDHGGDCSACFDSLPEVILDAADVYPDTDTATDGE